MNSFVLVYDFDRYGFLRTLLGIVSDSDLESASKDKVLLKLGTHVAYTVMSENI